MSTLIKDHPGVSLFLLAFLLGALPLALVAEGLLPVGFSQLGALSASAAGFILAGVESGRAGVGELFRRGLLWRVKFRFWALAIFYTAPLAAAALYFGVQILAIDFSLTLLRPLFQVIPMMIVLILLAGFGEEFGWRGFLLPRLQQNHTALTSSLIIGIFHSLWHIPLFLVDGTAQSDWAQQIGLLPAFLGYSTFVIAWAIQLTWFFNSSGGSVLMVAVVHGAGNAWIGGYFDISGFTGITGNNVLTTIMVLLSIALVAIAGPKQLSSKP